MFSKSCEYAIRSCIYISSCCSDNVRPNLTQIASAIDSPESFTSKILQALVRQGLVTSIRGVSGGFEISLKQARTIRILDIVYAIDGTDVSNRCVLGLNKCSSHKPCPLHSSFSGIREKLNDVLGNTLLSELHEQYEEGQTFLSLKPINK